jgi:hypothetical protein
MGRFAEIVACDLNWTDEVIRGRSFHMSMTTWRHKNRSVQIRGRDDLHEVDVFIKKQIDLAGDVRRYGPEAAKTRTSTPASGRRIP